MAVLDLRFCARAFSSCGKSGPLFIAARGPLTTRPLLLRSTGSRRAGSATVAHGPTCSTACGILPDQGSNPCPPHWQADSQPLRHQGSPVGLLLQLYFAQTEITIFLEQPRERRREVSLGFLIHRPIRLSCVTTKAPTFPPFSFAPHSALPSL